MVDSKIGSSIPSNINTANTNTVEIPPELELPPQVPTNEDPKVADNNQDSLNKTTAETKGFMDLRGEFLRRSLDGKLGSPVSQNLPPGVMQFAGPLAAPEFAKKIADAKLTDEQQAAKTQLEQSPAWKVLSDAQKTQVTITLSKVSGQ